MRRSGHVGQRCRLPIVAVLAGAVVLGTAGASGAATGRGHLGSARLIVVSNTSDSVNGNVSSPAALIAHPGPDGVSLREAILAANHGAGFVAITFAPSLAGRTITPATSLPAFTRGDTALVGSTDPDGQPAVTLDAANAPLDSGLLRVLASGTSISHLRIVGVTGLNTPDIAVWAGESDGERHVAEVSIESNVLDNDGTPGTAVITGVNGIVSPDGALVANASLSDITIADNVIEGFTGDGINVAVSGTDCTLSDLVVEENTFSDETGPDNPALEIGEKFSGNRITGTRIVGNTFTGDTNTLYVDGGLAGVNEGKGGLIPASKNSVSDTVISQNVFEGDQNAMQIVGGGGGADATGNAVSSTEISDDVIANSSGTAVYVFGGENGGSGNSVDGLEIVNDTIAFNPGGGLWLDDGGSGNQISGTDAENTIFWQNGDADVAGPASGSVTLQSSLTGVDPLFVSSSDFDLEAGSPAIDAGTASGAPAYDIENRARAGAPDIGAYEFGATPRPSLDVDVETLGGTGAVSSIPAGIDCETTYCDAAFDAGTAVTLTARASSGSVFGGWSGGGCSGTGTCTVTMDAARTVTATFRPRRVPSRTVTVPAIAVAT